MAEKQHEKAIDDFRKTLKGCTVEASCGRPLVLVTRLTTWLMEKCEMEDYTQVERLLDAAYQERTATSPGLPIKKDNICDNNDSSLKLFCILLDLGRGELIHELTRREKTDKNFPTELPRLIDVFRFLGEEATSVAASFDHLQWKYFPAILERNTGKEYHQNRVLPFTKIVEINSKGGTAQLFQVEVLEDFVGPNLRDEMKRFRYDVTGKGDDDGLGPRYHFALKRFKHGSKGVYENEVRAFHALSDKEALVRYLGNFEHAETVVQSKDQKRNGDSLAVKTLDTERPKLCATYNILLEYGEWDLEEYFADNVPPYLQREIECFYQELFAVAGDVKEIHHLKISSTEGGQTWHGWHADIKPDNILIVKGKYKLADPGFMMFIKSTEGTPKELPKGGTMTYGAPECHHFWTTSPTKVTQTIDIWSLACVLSVTATWVVLGLQGLRQYEDLRKAAIRNLIDNPPKVSPANPVGPVLSRGDYFHDGRNALTAVKGWHQILLKSVKPADNVTARLLNLVDSKMLLADPEARISAADLCTELRQIMKDASKAPRILIETEIEKLLREVDDSVPGPMKVWESLESNATMKAVAKNPSDNLPSGTRTIKQERKSKFLGPALQKTSHRSQVLTPNSDLDSQAATSHQPLHLPHLEPIHASPQQTPQLDNSPPPVIRRDDSEDSNLQTVESPRSYTDQVPGLLSQNGHSHSDSIPSVTLSTTHLHHRRYKDAPNRQDVFQARREVEERKYGPDPLLRRHYGNRDIKILVDNAETMDRFWYETEFLLETLLLKARDQDPDGMDLYFTSGPIEVQGSEIRKGLLRTWPFKDNPFMKAMKNEKVRPTTGLHTDPQTSISDILYAYLNDDSNYNGKKLKKLTLIVLTDGLWTGMSDRDGVGNLIVDFVRDLREKMKSQFILKQRPVSIQFIQLGDNPEAESRLRALDDLLVGNDIPDIVDYERSNGDVNKMLLGSFVEEYDMKEDDDEMMTYSPTRSNVSVLDTQQAYGTPSRAPTLQSLPPDQRPRNSGPFNAARAMQVAPITREPSRSRRSVTKFMRSLHE